MANRDDYYRFQDEDEDMDEICNHAYNRWEQSNEEEALNQAYDQFETHMRGGSVRGPLFKFKMVSVAKRRTWRDVVRRDQFYAELQQLRQPLPTDNMGLALTEALHRAIENEIQRERRPNHHFVNFTITANAFAHPYQSANFTVGEFIQRTVRIDELLAKLAGKLNSNESFNPSEGFHVDVVIVAMPGRGSGRGKNRKVGQQCLDRVNKKKKCIIPIKNDDQLCCARAIVTMKAHCHRQEGVDEHRNWENLKSGQPVQEKLAKELHQQAGVPEGPCGIKELQQFQQALGSDYQLCVITRIHPFLPIFNGPVADKKILLLKGNQHFDGCTSFAAIMDRSYYCFNCQRAFNSNDKAHHPCKEKRCQACTSFNCPDYKPDTQPEMYCHQCNTNFFGPSCKRHHFDTKQCESHKTCKNCQAVYMVIKGKRHQCGFSK